MMMNSCLMKPYDFTPSIFSRLTAKEKECLNLLIQAKGTKSIARTLNISPYTVETHLRNIRNKTSLRYKNDLVDAYKKYLLC